MLYMRSLGRWASSRSTVSCIGSGVLRGVTLVHPGTSTRRNSGMKTKRLPVNPTTVHRSPANSPVQKWICQNHQRALVLRGDIQKLDLIPTSWDDCCPVRPELSHAAVTPG